MKHPILNNTGVSLMELSVAMLVSSLLVTALYRTQSRLTRETKEQATKSVIQQELLTSSEVLEKELRQAGLYLPGNGLRPVLHTGISDELVFYINRSGCRAVIASTAQPVDSIIIISGSHFPSGISVCLYNNSDTLYRKINRAAIGMTVDTLILDRQVGVLLQAATSNAVSADCYTYKIGTDPKCLIRSFNGSEKLMAHDIDSLKILLRDKNGTILTYVDEKIVSLQITAGGWIGDIQHRFFHSQDITITLRNRS